MVSNNQIDRADGRLKWHVLTAMRYLALGELPLTATPSAIETACTKMLNAIWLPPKDSLKVFSAAVALVKSTSRASEQDLRAKPFTDRLIAAAIAQHRATKPRKLVVKAPKGSKK